MCYLLQPQYIIKNNDVNNRYILQTIANNTTKGRYF